MTLFRMSTGEDWYKIMFDLSRPLGDTYGCHYDSCQGSGLNNIFLALSIVFFIFYILIVQYIMLNLFILVLMQNFEENYISADNPI